MKLIGNYHTHTRRCGHAALDEDEEYVLGAIEIGLTELGFSDHVPLPGIHLEWMRPEVDTIDDYVNSIKALKEKYKDKINIHIGYEAEFDEKYLDYYKDILKNRGIEYLICGQHCYFENGEHMFYNMHKHDINQVRMYIDSVIKGIKSGIYTYIAHPDHFMNGYQIWDKDVEIECHKLFKVVEEYQIPLEINVGGIRFAAYKHKKNDKGFPLENYYPCDEFWELAKEYNIKGIVGIDAHSRKDMTDGAYLEAIEFAYKHNISLISKLDL